MSADAASSGSIIHLFLAGIGGSYATWYWYPWLRIPQSTSG